MSSGRSSVEAVTMQTMFGPRTLFILVVHTLQGSLCNEISEFEPTSVEFVSQCVDEDVYRCAQKGWFCLTTAAQPACTGLTECPDIYAKKCALLGKQCVMEWGRPGCRRLVSIDALPPVPSQCPEELADHCALVGARCVLKGDKPACVQPRAEPTTYEYISPCLQEDIHKCALEEKACIMPHDRRQCAVVSQCPQELERKCAMAQKHCIRINDVPLCEREVRIRMTMTVPPMRTIITHEPGRPTIRAYDSPCSKYNRELCSLTGEDCIVDYNAPKCAVVSRCPKELEEKCVENVMYCILIHNVPICEAGPRRIRAPTDDEPPVPSQCLADDIKYCWKKSLFCVVTDNGPACTRVSQCHRDGTIKCALLGKQCSLFLNVEVCSDLVPISSLPTDSTTVRIPAPETPGVSTLAPYISPCPKEGIKKCGLSGMHCINIVNMAKCAVVSWCPKEVDEKCLKNDQHCILVNNVPLCDHGEQRLRPHDGDPTPDGTSQCHVDDIRHCAKDGQFCVVFEGQPACTHVGVCREHSTKTCALRKEQCIVRTGREICDGIIPIKREHTETPEVRTTRQDFTTTRTAEPSTLTSVHTPIDFARCSEEREAYCKSIGAQGCVMYENEAICSYFAPCSEDREEYCKTLGAQGCVVFENQPLCSYFARCSEDRETYCKKLGAQGCVLYKHQSICSWPLGDSPDLPDETTDEMTTPTRTPPLPTTPPNLLPCSPYMEAYCERLHYKGCVFYRNSSICTGRRILQTNTPRPTTLSTPPTGNPAFRTNPPRPPATIWTMPPFVRTVECAVQMKQKCKTADMDCAVISGTPNCLSRR